MVKTYSQIYMECRRALKAQVKDLRAHVRDLLPTTTDLRADSRETIVTIVDSHPTTEVSRTHKEAVSREEIIPISRADVRADSSIRTKDSRTLRERSSSRSPSSEARLMSPSREAQRALLI